MIEQLIHKIKIRQSELQLSIAKGFPATWEYYQRMVGEHEGLQRVLDTIDNMLEEDRNQD